MKLITPTLALFTAVATALPNTNISRRSVEATINFFERYDCQSHCVETGLCLSGQADLGMPGSADDWIGWDSGCWDLPEGAHSVAIAVNNGHKFTGIDKHCKKWKDDGFEAQRWQMKVADGGDGKCNHFYNGKIKAIYYHW